MDPWVLVAGFLVGTIATARAVRLVTADSFPPVFWVREWFAGWAEQTPNRAVWGPLLTCPFCFAPYAAAVNLTWAYASDLDHTGFWGAAWWAVNTWATVSYLAAMIVTRDEP